MVAVVTGRDTQYAICAASPECFGFGNDGGQREVHIFSFPNQAISYTQLSH
jgi:hypothetical protein